MEILDYFMKRLKEKEVDHAVLSFNAGHSRQIKFSDNQTVKDSVETLSDVGIFVVKDKKIFTTTYKNTVNESGLGSENSDLNEMNKKEMDRFVERIMKFLKTLHPKEDYMGLNNKTFKYKEIKQGYDKRIMNLNDHDYVQRGINAAFKEGAKRTNGIFEVHESKNTTLTSHGAEYSEKKSELYFSMRSFIEKDESGHMNALSRVVKGLNPEKLGSESGRIAKEAKNPVNGKRGNYDIIFSPMAIAPLLDSIGESASIFSVESGMSFFTDKLGKKIGSDKITIYDDGTLANGSGSTKADAEGVPAKKTALIENGIYKNYLYNTSTARKYNVQSTGNAGLVTPDPWNIVVKPGNISLNEMVKSIKRGIYITNVWYTRFTSYSTGDFSTIPRDGAFLIENGKVTKSLKGIRISENVLRMLKNIDAVGKKSVHLRSWEAELPVMTPHLLVRGCSITTPTV